MTKLFDFDHRQIEQNFSNSCKEKFRTRDVNKSCEQAEAEVVPSSSLVDDGIEVEVEFEVEVGVEVDVDVEVDATLSFRHSLDGVQILFRWLGGWGGWRNGD